MQISDIPVCMLSQTVLKEDVGSQTQLPDSPGRKWGLPLHTHELAGADVGCYKASLRRDYGIPVLLRNLPLDHLMQ